MTNVICIYHVPQECGSKVLIFVDASNGQIIKEITVNSYRDWDAYHKDIITEGPEIIYYRKLAKGVTPNRMGEYRSYEGNEYFSAYTDKTCKTHFHPEGNFVIIGTEIVDTSECISPGRPMKCNIWKITMRSATKTDYIYHPNEDYFYTELAEQGITLNEMTQKEWLHFSDNDLINLIAEQLDYNILNIIRC